MDLVRPGLIGMGVAAATGALVLLAAALVGRRAPPDRPASRWALPLALGLGYALGHAVVRGWPPVPLPPLDATDWTAWLAPAAALFGTLDAARPAPAWARWENRLILTALALGLLLSPLFQSTWTTNRQGAEWLVGLGPAILAWWSMLDGRADRLGRSAVMPLLLFALGLAAVLASSGSLLLGMLAGVLAAPLAVAWIFAWAAPNLSLARGGVPVLVVVLSTLLLGGYFYADVPTPSALLLAAAPAATWIDRAGPVRRLRPWQTAAVRNAAILVPIAAAVAVALIRSPSADGY